jgi:hypothetical protein
LNNCEEPQDVGFFMKTKRCTPVMGRRFYCFHEVLVLKGTGRRPIGVLSLPLGRAINPEKEGEFPQTASSSHKKSSESELAAFSVLNLGIFSEAGNNYYRILRFRQAD